MTFINKRPDYYHESSTGYGIKQDLNPIFTAYARRNSTNASIYTQ
jgi:hypothetical protein